jgi:hypothetical protein
MAGFVALNGGDFSYLGRFVSDVDAGVKNGQFVVVNHATDKAVLADATTGDGAVYFVENEIDTIDEQFIDDADYAVKKGKFLRIKKPHKGQVYVTTEFTGTFAKGDKVAVGAGGKAVAIGTRTPETKFVVQEVTTAYGLPALNLLVI